MRAKLSLLFAIIALGACVAEPVAVATGFTPPRGSGNGSTASSWVDVTRACGATAGAATDCSADVEPVVACWIAAYPNGVTLHFPAGCYDWRTALTISTNGISFIGDGPAATFLKPDDTHGAVGDVITQTVNNLTIANMTIGAIAARTSGALVSVVGYQSISATPAQETRQLDLYNVVVLDQYDVLKFRDSAGSVGAWGAHVHNVDMLRSSAGGTYIDINTPHGGQLYFTDVKIYGSQNGAAATRAFSGIRYRGGSDVEGANITVVYTQYGMVADPPSGQQANVFLCDRCDFDSVSTLPLKVAPASGGSVGVMQFTTPWFANSAGTVSSDAVNISGDVRAFTILGGYVQALTGGNGIKVDGTGWSSSGSGTGPLAVTVVGTHFLGGARGFWATNGASHWKVTDAHFGGWNGASPPSTACVQVDASSTHYKIDGDTGLCSTGVTDNGSAPKSVTTY